MKLLLDTHVLLWALSDSPRLTPGLRAALGSAQSAYLSAVSVWEISIKRALGKLEAEDDIVAVARRAGCLPLSITWDHADRAGRLPPHHADPFDRLLIAQALCEGMVLATADAKLAKYGVALVEGA
jgi:PIN domain nuclease of toxin-antitoxin system